MAGSTSHCNLGVRLRVWVLGNFLFANLHLPPVGVVVALACRNRLRLRRYIPQMGLQCVGAGSGTLSAVAARQGTRIRSQKRSRWVGSFHGGVGRHLVRRAFSPSKTVLDILLEPGE